MARNLDLTALRSFVTVSEVGGVTRAASLLNLTQSAVSMQLKRLEDSVGRPLLDRTTRSVALTGDGEQLLSYARRMLDLNDDIWRRLTSEEYEGEVVLGVPHDIVYPAMPGVLRAFAARYPRVKVQLISSFTTHLKGEFAQGRADLIVTTEDEVGADAETLAEMPLVWVGAPKGQAWKQRPLRLAHEQRCIFRPGVRRRLDRAGIQWESAIETQFTRTVEATVSADLAVHTMLRGSIPPHLEEIDHGGALPDLRVFRVNLYTSDVADSPVTAALADLIRQAYRD